MKLRAEIPKLTEKSYNMQDHKIDNQVINSLQYKWKWCKKMTWNWVSLGFLKINEEMNPKIWNRNYKKKIMERRNKNRWEFLKEPISIIAMKTIVNGLKQTQKISLVGGLKH